MAPQRSGDLDAGGRPERVVLSHADRSRILAGQGPGLPFPQGGSAGTLLANGFHRAHWEVSEDAGAATLTVDRFSRHDDDAPGTLDEIAAEGARLLSFLVPEARAHRVLFVPEL